MLSCTPEENMAHHGAQKSDDDSKTQNVSEQTKEPIKPHFCDNNGEGGIRTRGTGLCPYDGLANRYLQPLGHLSKFLKYKGLQIYLKYLLIENTTLITTDGVIMS